MKRFNKYCYCCLILFSFIVNGVSQSLEISKVNYDIRDGLLGMQVTSLFQDSKGRLVIGTKLGACIFDGRKFHSARTGIPLNIYSSVHKVVELSNGDLLISTDDGICKYNNQTTDFFVDRDSFFARTEFVKAGNDIIYFLNRKNTLHELCKIENGKIEQLNKINKQLHLNKGDFRHLTYDRQLECLILIHSRLDSSNLRQQYIVLIDEKTGDFIESPNMLLPINKDSHQFLHDSTGATYLTIGSSILKIYKDSLVLKGVMPNRTFCSTIFSTIDGINFYGAGDGDGLYKIRLITKDSSFIENIGADFTLVTSMLRDDGKRLWIGKEDGLSVIPNEAFFEKKYDRKFKYVWGIAQDGLNNIWFNTYGYGITKYNYDEDTFKTLDLRKLQGLDTLGAKYMYFGSLKDSKGDLYLPMSQGGLRYDYKLKKLYRLNSENLRMATLYAYEDLSQNFILFGSQDILLYNKEKSVVDTLSSKRFGLNCYIRTICQDSQHNYWIGGQKGIWKGKIDLETKETTRLKLYRQRKEIKGEVLCSYVDENQAVWLGTTTGLYRYNLNKDSFIQTLPQKLQGGVLFITPIDKESLLLTSRHELLIYNIKDNKFRSVGASQGLTGVDFALNGVIRDYKGYYWIPHADKISRFNIKELPPLQPPKSYMVSVELREKMLDLQKGSFNFLDKKIDTLSSSIEALRINFSAVSFDFSEDFTYQYRLLEVNNPDSMWCATEYQHQDFDIKGGEYCFELQACSETTGCEESITQWRFYRELNWDEEHWYVTYGLVALVVIIVVGIIAFWLHKKKLHKKQKELYLSKYKLTSLTNQLHPHFLLNALNSLYGSIPNNHNSNSNSITSFAHILREAIKNSDKLFQSLKEELKLVVSYIEVQKARFPNKFDYELDISDDVDERQLVPKIIIQSFVSNSIRHGFKIKKNNGKIIIRIRQVNDCLNITIIDNGDGLYKSIENDRENKSTGTGIRTAKEIIKFINEQRSASTIKAELHIQDRESVQEEEGVYVSIAIPSDLKVDEDGNLI